MSLHAASAGEILALLAAKQLSSVEVLQHVIARIEAHDEAINAVVVRDFVCVSPDPPCDDGRLWLMSRAWWMMQTRQRTS